MTYCFCLDQTQVVILSARQLVLVFNVMFTSRSDHPDWSLRLGQDTTATEKGNLYGLRVVQVVIGQPNPCALRVYNQRAWPTKPDARLYLEICRRLPREMEREKRCVPFRGYCSCSATFNILMGPSRYRFELVNTESHRVIKFTAA